MIIIEELLNGGAQLKYNRARKMYFEKAGELIAKECSVCKEVKYPSDFPNQKGSLWGLRPNCYVCEVARRKKSYQDNRDKTLLRNQINYINRRNYILAQKAEYYDSNRKVILQKNQEWCRTNPEKARLIKQRRRARAASLPDTLTQFEIDEILKHFDGGCALTGDKVIELDHVIPLATGYGGTTFQNIVPLRKDLNNSKKHSNIFEWFDRNQKRFNLSREKFDELILWLAKVNAVTVCEYKSYVNFCHDNQRDGEVI